MQEEEQEKKESTGKKTFSNLLFIMTIVFIAIFLYARYIEVKNLRIKEYKVESEKIPSQFSGFKIIHISDILYGSTIGLNELDNIVNRINMLKPDLVVFTGNLISINKTINDNTKKEIVSLLEKINPMIGKYYVNGKFDKDISKDLLKRSDFKELNNTNELLYYKDTKPILISGLSYNNPDFTNIYTLEKENNLENISPQLKEDYYKIVLTSEGDNAIELLKSQEKPDLILAGNSLGGLVNIPFYGPLFLFDGNKMYYGEYYKKEETNIFVSSGIGTNKYNYRFLNKPSFNLYRLKSI